jgi:UDP-N-acetylglucosamine transferase subunit ALG13
LAAARLHRVPSFYIESVSRVKGPSASGRIVALDRKIDISCQYRSWVHGRWYYRGTLFDQYEAVAHESVEKPRLFVTLGTIAPYRFDAMVDAILATGLADERTVWQLGCTDRGDLPGRVCKQMSGRDFDACVEEADVVITHSGVGTIMKLLDMGVCPVVIPRRVGRKEHVDDHQVQIAGVVEERGIAVVAEAPELTREAVVRASSITVRIPDANTPSVQVADSLEGALDLEVPRPLPNDKGYLV